MKNKQKSQRNDNKAVSEAARALAQRSVATRKKKWGAKDFRKRMQEWGKLGGRPRKAPKRKKGSKTS